MSVELALELSLDERAASLANELMDRLEAAGVASLRHLAPHVHPHVSIAVATAAPGALVDACRGLGEGLPTLTLSGLGAFVAPARVVFLAVTPSDELSALNRAVHERLDRTGIECRPLYRPGSYVPHVTLAMHVASVGATLAVVEDVALPVVSTPGRLGVVEVPTGRLLAEVP